VEEYPLDLIASTTVFAEGPQTGRRTVVLAITAPEASDGAWWCSVALDGLESASRIAGEDSLQALGLAVAYLRHRISHYMANGWRFFSSQSEGDPLDLPTVYFPEKS
jgi:hypothetical protein